MLVYRLLLLPLVFTFICNHEQPGINISKTYSVFSTRFKSTVQSWTLSHHSVLLPEQHNHPHLINKTIRIAVVHDPPFSMLAIKNDMTTVTGYVGDILQTLAENINARLELVVTEDNEYGSLINSSWTGMIGLLIQNKADVASAVTITLGRHKFIDFSVFLYPSRLILLYRVSDAKKWDIQFFFIPFQRDTWICIFAINFIVSMLALYHKFARSNQRSVKDFRKLMIIFDLSEEIPLCWPAVTAGGGTSLIFSKVISTTYLLFAIIMIQIYSSNLTAFLSIAKIDIPFDSLQEMVEKKEYFPVVVEGTNIQEDFSGATADPWKTGWELMKQNRPNSLVKNVQEGIDASYTNKAGFVVSITYISHFIKGNCSFAVARQPVGYAPGNLAYSKSFESKDIFNFKVLQMKEVGVLSVLNNRYFPEWEPCLSTNDFNPVILGQLIGPIALFLAGVSFSIIIGVLETAIFSRS